MKYAICTIIKDERRYLEEWIIHCLGIGFDTIRLYEDYGSESHKDITDKYGNVHLHSYDEVEVTDYSERDKKQIDLFNHFVKQYRSEYDWCAFIDPDEYIRFEEGYTLERLCSEFSSYNGIMLQQKTYGANGHIQRPEGGVQENYTANPMEYHKPKFNMKTIVNLHKDILFKGVHRIQGAVFTNYTNRLKQPVCYQKAWYDHYYTKSWQDWMERFTKRGDVVPGNVKEDEFFGHNIEFEQYKEKLYDMMPLYIHKEQHHNISAPSIIVPYIIELLKPKSVVDVGCGVGTFLHAFINEGITDVQGIDGEWVNKELLHKHVDSIVIHDLEKKYITDRKFDIALCLEVAEHLYNVDNLLDALISLSDIVVFSAAIPNQGGQHHVNEHWQSWWKDKFDKRGYLAFDYVRPFIWNNEDVFWWYKQNTFVYIKREHPELGNIMSRFQRLNLSNTMMDCVHPELYTNNTRV